MKKKMAIFVVLVALFLSVLIICINVFEKHEAKIIRNIVSENQAFKEINARKDITFDDNITLQNKAIDDLISKLESEKHSKKIITKDLEEYVDYMIESMENQKELNIALQNEHRCDIRDEKAYKECVNYRNIIKSKCDSSYNKANSVYKSITGEDMIKK